MRIRRFGPLGLSRFDEALEEVRAGRADGLPSGLLHDEALTVEVGAELPEGMLAGAPLGRTRLDAAAHLDRCFTAAGLTGVESDAGVWAWLAAVHFDALCPRGARGVLRPGARPTWIPSATDSGHWYRHRLLGPWLIFAAHREDALAAFCVLAQNVRSPGSIVERLASRPRLIACRSAMRVATLVLLEGASVRREATDKVRRLVDVFMQLDRTFDLYSMETDDLIALMPADLRPRPGKERRRSPR